TAREIVKKKQGLSTLHGEIVDRQRNQVDADRVVPPGLDCDLYFCADAVGRSDQNRVAKAGLFEVEQSAKSADLRVSTRSCCRAHQRPDQVDHAVPRVDIDTR